MRTNTLPTYEWAEVADDGDLFEPELHGPPAPLPENLLDPSSWDVPRVKRLLDLTEDRTIGEAFELWATETLGGYERAWELTAKRNTDVPHLQVARMEALRVFEQAKPQNHGGFTELRPQYKAALQPFRDARMSMRAIAAFVGLSLHDVVVAFMSGRCAAKAEAIADLEEKLLDGALLEQSTRQLLKDTGLHATTMRALCKAHGIDARAAQSQREAVAA